MQAKIMIVDDTEVNRELLVDLLEDDFELVCCENGQVALQQLDVFEPDIILLDVMMPVMDGYETCRNIRQDERFASTNIIMISAADQDEDKLVGYKAGCDDYLAKPVDSKILRAKIELSLKNISEKRNAIAHQEDLHQQFLMSEANTLDVMASFLENIVKAPNYQALADALKDALGALGVNCALRIFGIDEPIIMGCQPNTAPWALIHDAEHADISGIPQLYRSKHVVLLAKNFSKDKTPLLEQISDRINILMRGVDARLTSLIKEPSHELQTETSGDVQWMVAENYNAIAQAKQLFADHELLSRDILDGMMQKMDALLMKLGLTEEQEQALIDMLEDSAEALNGLYSKGSLIEDTLDKSMALLQPMLGEPDVDLF